MHSTLNAPNASPVSLFVVFQASVGR
jgi:hypothetical protein